MTYDDLGRMHLHVSFEGVVKENVYDGFGRMSAMNYYASVKRTTPLASSTNATNTPSTLTDGEAAGLATKQPLLLHWQLAVTSAADDLELYRHPNRSHDLRHSRGRVLHDSQSRRHVVVRLRCALAA